MESYQWVTAHIKVDEVMNGKQNKPGMEGHIKHDLTEKTDLIQFENRIVGTRGGQEWWR